MSAFKGLGDKIKGLGAGHIKIYAKGLNFPASKQDVESAFKKNGAPAELMSALGKLPGNTNFKSLDDLVNTLKSKL